MMKWDVKHDRAKRVIDAFLENAGYWQDREDLSAGLADEDKEQVNAEVALMIASIRKRYKLQERLPEQATQIQSEEVETVIPTEKAEETFPEPVSDAEKGKKSEEATADTEKAQEPAEKPKRNRKVSGTEKKPAAKRGRREKTV